MLSLPRVLAPASTSRDHRGGVPLGEEVLGGLGAAGSRQAADVKEILVGKRHAVERAAPATRGRLRLERRARASAPSASTVMKARRRSSRRSTRARQSRAASTGEIRRARMAAARAAMDQSVMSRRSARAAGGEQAGAPPRRARRPRGRRRSARALDQGQIRLRPLDHRRHAAPLRRGRDHGRHRAERASLIRRPARGSRPASR